MRRFLLNALAFALLQLAVLAGLWSLWADWEGGGNEYWAATVDKHARLAATPAPRLVLVGDSNLAFGIRSERLEQALGRPVVNMAMAGNWQPEWALREVEDALRPGDWVVLSFAPDWWDMTSPPHMPKVYTLARVRPAALLDYDDWETVQVLLDEGLRISGPIGAALFRRLAGVTGDTRYRTPPYTRDSFNGYGDVTGHHVAARRQPPRDVPVMDFETYQGFFDGLDAWARAREAEGVRVVYTPPPVAESHYERNRDLLGRLDALLRRETSIPLTHRQSEMLYPEADIFDSAYHLTEEASARRTDELAEALQRLLVEDG